MDHPHALNDKDFNKLVVSVIYFFFCKMLQFLSFSSFMSAGISVSLYTRKGH
jgi:hypothetical protein